MTNATAISTAQAARIAASLLDRAAVAGLSVNATLSVGPLGVNDVVLHGEDAFADVRRWASWLGAKVNQRVVYPDLEFIEADFEVDGAQFKVCTNRQITKVCGHEFTGLDGNDRRCNLPLGHLDGYIAPAHEQVDLNDPDGKGFRDEVTAALVEATR